LATDREALTRQIKEANDIVDVVGAYLTLHPAGGKFKGLCPFHDDHNPSLVVDPQWQNFRCWACGKSGDVFTFIQEKDRVDFREARELLARRAGISLEKIEESPQNTGRAFMLDVMRWAEEQYQRCLQESPLADAARRYLAERRLAAETSRRFGLGYAPPSWEWLVEAAARARVSTEVLEKVGLIARRDQGGWYDRFRDRIMFPIRNTRAQTVGFGGRILPSSPSAADAPKYYNSADSPLFSKSEQLYGLDQARQPASSCGYLAVVEGYTDVLMCHQHGICQVVATMGTALNARHVQHLRRIVPRVVLVFDADPGGASGVDRALELFVSQDVELAIASLPQGLDPCELLVQQGPEPLRAALAGAVDALDFKLNQVLASPEAQTLEGRRRAVEDVLGIVARAPELTGQAGQIKRELILGRIAHRFGLREATLWERLQELRGKQRPAPALVRRDEAAVPQTLPAAPHERDLLQVLLASPDLVPAAAEVVQPEWLEHPGLRRLLEELYRLQAEGRAADVERLRERIDNPRLVEHAFRARDIGLQIRDRAAALERLIEEFHRRRQSPRRQELYNQLCGVGDDATAIELLRRLQNDRELSG
jgi:DNA primase